MKAKGNMNSADDYLKTYGIDALLQKLCCKFADDRPEDPLNFLRRAILDAKANYQR